MSDLFDEQVAGTATDLDGHNLQEVYDLIKDFYNFRIPEGAEEGNLAFNTMDYFNMEIAGAWLKKKIEADAALRERVQALEAALQDAKYVIEEFAVEQPIGVGPQWRQAFINAINWMRNNK